MCVFHEKKNFYSNQLNALQGTCKEICIIDPLLELKVASNFTKKRESVRLCTYKVCKILPQRKSIFYLFPAFKQPSHENITTLLKCKAAKLEIKLYHC